MADHIADAQPRHSDPGMDALIRHLENPQPKEPAPVEAEAVEVPVDEQPTVEEVEAAPEQPVEEEFEEDPLVPVMVGGIEEQVPLSELMRGYSRNSDYTRKTQALAEERRQMEGERSQLMLAQREAVERMASLASQLETEMRTSQKTPEELNALRASDPAEYAAVIADQQRKAQLVQQAQQQATAYQQQQAAQRVQYERSQLAEKEPAFASDFEGTYAALGRWITDPNGGGVSVEDWNREYDHNRILIAYKAMQASQQGAAAQDRQTAVRAKVANLPRIRPGVRQEPGDTERATAAAAFERMKETGTTRDIAAALQARSALRRRSTDGTP